MAEAFDPYYRWLAIPAEEQPPNHYRLLGVKLFESDADVIQTAADRQMAHLRTFQMGARAELSQRLLNEMAAARLCLVRPESKVRYDAELRSALAARAAPTTAGPPVVEPAALDYLWSDGGRHYVPTAQPPGRRNGGRKASAVTLIAVGAGVLLLAGAYLAMRGSNGGQPEQTTAAGAARAAATSEAPDAKKAADAKNAPPVPPAPAASKPRPAAPAKPKRAVLSLKPDPDRENPDAPPAPDNGKKPAPDARPVGDIPFVPDLKPGIPKLPENTGNRPSGPAAPLLVPPGTKLEGFKLIALTDVVYRPKPPAEPRRKGVTVKYSTISRDIFRVARDGQGPEHGFFAVDGKTTPVVWRSSNPGSVRVIQNQGEVGFEFSSSGKATVTASVGAWSEKITVEVRNLPFSLGISANEFIKKFGLPDRKLERLPGVVWGTGSDAGEIWEYKRWPQCLIIVGESQVQGIRSWLAEPKPATESPAATGP